MGRLLNKLLQKDVLKRAIRKAMNECLKSPFLSSGRPHRELQAAHESTMAALKSGSSGRLRGKVAIITGGASGIGEATALLFAREGARVVIADLKRGAIDQITTNGGEARFFQTDLTDAAQVESMVRETLVAFGRIDVLVNNVGAPIGGSLVDQPPDTWQRSIELNLTTAYLCCRHVVPEMSKSGSGSIVMISSIQGVCGISGAAGYAAAKGGLIAMTRQAARDFAGAGIRVNCVSPGVIRTPLFEDHEHGKAMLEQAAEYTPLGIVGIADDIAYLNLFLASDESSYITGQNFVADGGITMRGL